MVNFGRVWREENEKILDVLNFSDINRKFVEHLKINPKVKILVV